jgi:serine/threonine-protein kinase
MLAGEPPFKGTTAFEVAVQHVRDVPPPLQSIRPDLPGDLCALVHKMMAKNPDDRYQSCRDLLKDLAHVRESLNGATGFGSFTATGLVEPAPTPTRGSVTEVIPRIRRPKKRPLVKKNNNLLVALIVGGVVLIAGGVGLAIAIIIQNNRSLTDDEDAPVARASESASLERREQDKKRVIDECLDPGRGFKNPDIGVRCCLDYVLPLLEPSQNRLNEADELFKRLEAIQQVEQYHTLGLVGRGIVYALKDNWNDSMKMFNAVPNHSKGGRGGFRMDGSKVPGLIKADPRLGYWLAEAVHRNQTNNKSPTTTKLPPYLQSLVRGGNNPSWKDRWPGGGFGGRDRDRKSKD